MHKQSTGDRVFNAFNILFMCVMMVVMLYPLYYAAIVSISNGNAVLTGSVKLYPVGINFKSYEMIFSDNEIIVAFLNSVKYTVVGTAINIVLTTLAAYPLSRPRLFGKRVFMAMFAFTMFFSGGMIPMYLIISQLGMINTIWAMVLPGAISTYNMVIMRTFFQGIPYTLQEAAVIDGANEPQILLRIILPLSLPIFSTMTLFYAVGHWNSFMNALLYINKRNMYPIQMILRNMAIMSDNSKFFSTVGAGTEFTTVMETIRYAVIMVATLPILLVYPFLQKYFVKGVMIGSLKG